AASSRIFAFDTPDAPGKRISCFIRRQSGLRIKSQRPCRGSGRKFSPDGEVNFHGKLGSHRYRQSEGIAASARQTFTRTEWITMNAKRMSKKAVLAACAGLSALTIS